MSGRGAVAIVLGLIAAVGLALFFWGDGGAARADADGARVLYLALAAILVGGGVFHRGGGRPGVMVRNLLIWAGIIAVLAVGFAKWQDRQPLAPQGGEQLTHAEPAAPKSNLATIKKSADGHFWTDARVNGRPQRFMIDTGASVVVLPMRDAKRLGLKSGDLDFTSSVETANGPARAARVTLREVRVANVTMRNVDAVVLEDGLDTALLGMSFLNRLSSFEARADSLRLRS